MSEPNRPFRSALRRAPWLLAAAIAALCAAEARAQSDPADCDCELTGDYVPPDPGVRLGRANVATGLSPSGRYRVVVTSVPGQTPATLNVERVSSGATLLSNVAGVDWGFSPDDDRFVIGSSTGAPPNQQFEYSLYDLSAAGAPRIWQNGPTPWASARIRFSDDGSVFLFAGANQTVGVSLSLLEVASRSLFETSFQPSSPPGDVDDDEDSSVAGWGFGPNPSRFVYAWVASSGTGLVQWGRVNVATRAVREEGYTANSMYAVFSPCGDAIAFVVKQLATSDLTDVSLYRTLVPAAGPIGAAQLPFPDLLVQSTAALHEVLQGGETTPLAANRAGDACSVSNDPPTADFSAPTLEVGTPGAFTDQSSDADGQVVAWSWDFGDGATSSTQSPSHAYAAAGVYRVALTVTDDDGATDSFERDITACGSVASLSGRVLVSGLASLDEPDLFALNVDDGSTVRLTNRAGGRSIVRDARFSPDGTRIAYADRGIFLAGIWVMNADGSQRRRLTDGDGARGDSDFHDQPTWSPDGAWIAFRSDDVVAPDAMGLWMVRADGSDLTRVPNTAFGDTGGDFADEIAAGCGAIAPAQREPGCYTLLFSRAMNPGTVVARIRGDGTDFGALTPVGSFGAPRVSPDGDAIAYTRILGLSGPIGGVTRVFARDLASGAEREIARGGDDIFASPTWSPDGGAIAYAYSVNGVPGRIDDYEIGVSDGMGCSGRSLYTGPGYQLPNAWATGRAVQGLGSIAGRVGLNTNSQAGVAGAIVAISGDVSGTATADANGDFVFENVPIGANVTIRFVSAPGYVAFDIPPWHDDAFVGHAVGVSVLATSAEATVLGTIRTDGGERLADVALTADGAGGPFTAHTNAMGDYVLSSLATYQQYTLTPSLPGYRFEPPTATFTAFGPLQIFDFTAIPLPPSGRIAFVRTGDEGDDEIFSADLDGANALNLTADPAHDRDPAWSPDGTRIVFSSDRGGSDALWVMDLDGSYPTPLEVDGREPAWSPDGAYIAFASDAGLGLLRLDDGWITSLTSDPADASPRFRTDRPDTVTFERTVGAGDTDFYEVTLRGVVTGPFGVSSPLAEVDPAWAADGARLAYATVSDANPGAPTIWMRDIATGESFGRAGGVNPTWSPDGEWRAYEWAGSIYYVDADDPAAQQRLATDSGTDRDPDWQPVPNPACANGTDDDGDGLSDLDDPGCADADDLRERGADPCDDTLDDDDDGFAAYPQDPGCSDALDFDEREASLVCDNGQDDDDDGVADFPADGGCDGPSGPTEFAECQDDTDNDGDGLADTSDPACGGDPNGRSEAAACQNGLDDDGDGTIDHSQGDPGCDDPNDSSERGFLVCDDEIDDDGDGFAAVPQDPGCSDALDFDEQSVRFACDDGADNDGDGLADMADPGCPFPYASPENPPCNDGVDNDGDGATDADDEVCQASWPFWEAEPRCGLGAELVLALGALARRRRRAV